MKKYILLISLVIIFFPSSTKAMERLYFINENGVILNEEEYNYIVKIFDKNFAKIMTKEVYDDLVNESLISSPTNIVETNNINPMSNERVESDRKIKISSTCTTRSCSITITFVWLKIPTVAGYDVMGAYLNSTKLLNSPTTILYQNNVSTSINELNIQDNGFGTSIKFDVNSQNVEIYQYFQVSKDGEVIASYQHAKQSVSLSDSKKYTISPSGYGGVFLFANGVKDKYSNNRGVSILV